MGCGQWVVSCELWAMGCELWSEHNQIASFLNINIYISAHYLIKSHFYSTSIGFANPILQVIIGAVGHIEAA